MLVFVKKKLDNKLYQLICIPNCTILKKIRPISMCAAIYHNFHIKLVIFFIQKAIKIYTKTQQLQHVFQ